MNHIMISCSWLVILLMGCSQVYRPHLAKGIKSPAASPGSDVTASDVSTDTSRATPTSGSIDTLDFFITKHPEKALLAADGTDVNQIIDVDLKQLYLMKWGPRSFIKYHWDEKYIYFDEEHEMDFPTAKPERVNYTFTPGYWLKRQMKVGDSIDGTNAGNVGTIITRFDTPHTCKVKDQDRYFMKTILESHQTSYNIGGDLGPQDIINLRIEQLTYSEKEMYSREYGLVQWQRCTLDGSSCDRTVTWNRFSPRPPKKLLRSASCTWETGLTDIQKIRKLSIESFGVQSKNDEAVRNQLNYLADGGSIATIEEHFQLIRNTWIAYFGAPPPEYSWVDVGMNFLTSGGTPEQYRTVVEDAVKKLK